MIKAHPTDPYRDSKGRMLPGVALPTNRAGRPSLTAEVQAKKQALQQAITPDMMVEAARNVYDTAMKTANPWGSVRNVKSIRAHGKHGST